MANRRQPSNGNRSFPHNSMTVHPWQTGMAPTMGLQHLISQLNDSQDMSSLAFALSNIYRGQHLQGSQQPPSLLAMPRYAPGNLNSFRQQYGRINRSVEGRRFGATKIQPRQTIRSVSSSQQKQRKAGTGTKTSLEKTNNKKRRNNKNKAASKTGSDEKKSENDENPETDGEKVKTEDGEENTDSLNADESSKENGENGTEKSDPQQPKAKKNKEGKYAGIPVQFLKCVVCDKTMWDGESFEKHLRGRAHKQMFESLEDSHKIQADMMRQTIRLAEERKAIELSRMRRLGKRVDFRKGTHCTMCDYNFFGQEAAHRKSDGHQKLKQFLHPRCKRCRLEFTTRIDWEEHKLTPEHLLKRVNARENHGGKGFEIIKGEGGALTTEDEPTTEEVELSIQEIRKNFLLDVTEDTDFIKDFKIRVPPYRKSRAVGGSFMTETTGNVCKLCEQFFLTKEATDIHCKSRNHYDKYIAFIKKENEEKTKELKQENGEEEEEEENQENGADGDNWKARKVLENGNDNKDDAYLHYDPFDGNDDVIIENIGENIPVADDDKGTGVLKVKQEEQQKEFWHQVDKDIDMILDDKLITSQGDDQSDGAIAQVAANTKIPNEKGGEVDVGEVVESQEGTPRTQRTQRTKSRSGQAGKARRQ